ncbi:MAG: hypothetical protein HOC20_04355 [Chloroflexi bacterium]|nr:hypothetical protein [Chloroflexota bacterium]
MVTKTLTCPGCGCLCDDVEIDLDRDRITQTRNACTKGSTLLYDAQNPERRTRPLVSGNEVSIDEALEAAARLLAEAKQPMIFGLDHSTLETQSLALELAKKLGAVIDDSSSYTFGSMIEKIITGVLPTCSLDEVKDNADLLLYWGADPPHTHPRHLSTFTYYAYSDYTEAGWFPKVTMSCISNCENEFTGMCRPVFIVEPGEDKLLIASILSHLNGIDSTTDATALVEMIRNASFCTIFCGVDLIRSVNNDLDAFTEMVQLLSQSTRMAVIPMIEEPNLRGFNQLLHQKTGSINDVDFTDGQIHATSLPFNERVATQPADCALIIGADPSSMLPRSMVQSLQYGAVICLDHFITPNSQAADIVIPTGLPGLESAGTAISMDGEERTLIKARDTGYISESEALKQLMEKLL